jgi:hypothetical protein
MSTKRSRLFAASTSLFGSGKSGKQYVWSGGLPKFGKERKGKFQTPTSNIQKSSNAQAPKPQAAPHVKGKEPGLIARGFAKLKGLVGRKASNKSPIPQFSRQPVQGELSLDNVKVMRNDLSDTDFEFVAKPVAPKKAASTEAAPTGVTPQPESGTRIWNRVTTLLGAGQS